MATLSSVLGKASHQGEGWGAVAKMKGQMESSMAQNEAVGAMKRQGMLQQADISFRNDMAETQAKMIKGAGEGIKGLA